MMHLCSSQDASSLESRACDLLAPMCNCGLTPCTHFKQRVEEAIRYVRFTIPTASRPCIPRKGLSPPRPIKITLDVSSDRVFHVA